MLEAIPETEALPRLLDAAEALSGLPLAEIAAQGPAEALTDTRAAQPLLYLTDWAWGRALLDAGVHPLAVAGHSLGELVALAIAGVYSVEAGLELVIERSRLMAEATSHSSGAMAAVIGLDASGETPVETFRVPIEFKRKMGMDGVAKIGLGALGGVTGLAKGAISANKALLDVPVAATQTPSGSVVVRGKQHLLSFDPQAKTANWSLFYGAPSDTLGTVAMFAVTAAAAVYGNAQVAAGGSYGSSSYSSGVNTIHSNLDSYNKYTEKAAARAGSSKSSQAYAYVLTKVAKDIGVVGVNLATGEPDRELPLKEKEPDYLVDELMNRVFHFKGKNTIVGYQFGE